MTTDLKHSVIWVLAGVLGVATLAACGSAEASPEEAPSAAVRAAPVRVAAATVGEISVTTTYVATVQAQDLINVVPLATGRIEQLSVDIGSEVAKGQVIANLSHGILDAQLQQAEATLRDAHANLASVRAASEPKRLSAQAQLDAARAKLDQLLSRSEVNSGKSNPGQPLNPFTQDLRAAKSAIAAAQSKLDSAKTKLDQLLNPLTYDLQAAENDVSSAQSKLDSASTKLDQLMGPSAADIQAAKSEVSSSQSKLDSSKTKLDQLITPTASDLIKQQGAVTKAQGELAEVQEDVTKAISSHLDTGIMSGEEFDLWNLMLKAQTALQATRARILVQPSLLTDPSVAGKKDDSASAGLVEDLGIVETNTQAISTYLKELISFSEIPEAIASAMAAESDKKAAVETAVASLQELQDPNTNSIALARDDVAIAQAALDSAKAELAELEIPSSSSIDLLEDDVGIALASLNSAESTLTELKNPRPSAIAQEEHTVNEAQASLDASNAKLDALINPNPADMAAAQAAVVVAEQALALNNEAFASHDIEAAQARVDQSEAQLNLVKQRLSELQILAPVDGFVTQRYLAPGAMASQQTPVVTIAGNELVVSLQVEETALSSLKTGQLVTFTSPALPGIDLELKIDRVSPVGDAKAHTFLVQMYPGATAPDLKPGMSGQVEIANRHEDVVLVPKEAVLHQGGEAALFVVQDDTAHRVLVDLGLVDVKKTEIRSGVQDGDQIVITGQGLLKDGDRVKIEEPAKRGRRSGR